MSSKITRAMIEKLGVTARSLHHRNGYDDNDNLLWDKTWLKAKYAELAAKLQFELQMLEDGSSPTLKKVRGKILARPQEYGFTFHVADDADTVYNPESLVIIDGVYDNGDLRCFNYVNKRLRLPYADYQHIMSA